MKSLFKDKTVLITGGTGYLGRALIEEILTHDPHSVRAFSRDEVKHHKLKQQFPLETVRCLVGDIRDKQRLDKAMRGVDIVIHAAALKRVDLIEYNVGESIKTNILGTMNVVESALKHEVEKAVFVSTDKACAPVNTYGACKFVGERIFTASNYSKGDSPTVFCSVRYGNVLNSTGSVIPFFEQRIKQGKDIPVTDERMTRFIITHQEAVQLIFDALRYGVGGEVFVPQLPAFQIGDLVEVLKKKHNSQANTRIVGIRPGEKIHELMLSGADVRRSYEFKNRYVITSSIEKYQDLEQAPVYVREGHKISDQDMTEYSSRDSVLSQEQLLSLFEEKGLLDD